MDRIDSAVTPPAAAEESATRRMSWLALGAVVIVATVLRLHAIAATSLWLDEGISWQQASTNFAA
jgi:hypothetical protein